MRAHLTANRLWRSLILLVLATGATLAISMFMVTPEVRSELLAAFDEGNLFSHPQFILLWPRLLSGLLVGSVLASSGAALQGLLRNPLADPYILGVSGGAALGIAVVGILGLSGWIGEASGGFLGALTALMVVAGLATKRGRLRPLDMLLIGVIFNAFAGALLLLLETIGSPLDVQRVIIKLMGSLAHDPSEPMLLPALAVAALITFVFLFFNAHRLNLLSLGDTSAQSLGVDPDVLRRRAFVLLSIPIGIVVAVSGMIGFVGLIIPHAVRLALGPDHRLLIPASALVGAIFVLLADGMVRLLFSPLGTALPVGVMTAIIGGPVFVYLLRKKGYGGWR